MSENEESVLRLADELVVDSHAIIALEVIESEDDEGTFHHAVLDIENADYENGVFSSFSIGVEQPDDLRRLSKILASWADQMEESIATEH
jgi:hypothetical protein